VRDEVIEKYIEVRCRETGETVTEAVPEAAQLYGVSSETVWRAMRRVKKMRSTGKTAVS
jgi:hypothetical protein